ncbi:MAG: glycosyltransferase family 39 protein [Candidatus Omnitrophota bacterium]|nr:MAG: glycosyltransferase family 39 protein [Candidatus Omnitrophota bacterium]
MSKIKDFCIRNKTYLIIFAVMALYYIQRLISFRLGVNYEEGRDANAYLLAMQGYIPYRDFDWIHGPFSFFIYPFIMKVFGDTLVVLRLSYIVFASLAIPLSYFLARRIMPHFWAGIAAFLSVLFLTVPYYTFNHVFVVLGALVCLLMICRFIEKDKKILNLFLAGIFAAIALLAKPLLLGACLFAGISAYLVLTKDLGLLRRRFKNYSIFVMGVSFLVSIYFIYFYFQTAFRNHVISYPFFARDSLVIIEHIHRMKGYTLSFAALFERIKSIMPIGGILNAASFNELKQLSVISFDNFIFFLPFLASAVILLIIYRSSKFNMVRAELKEKILQDKKFLWPFVIFSVFISLEGVRIAHVYGRAFTMQVPFILTVYILFLIKTIYFRRSKVSTTFIVLFLFYLSFLHFFRYPYSMIRKYTKPLNLDRAKGICVTSAEKEFYESLTSYMSANFEKEDKMVVINSGYIPHLSFLTGRTNIFAVNEFMFKKLSDIVNVYDKRKDLKPLLVLLEDKIISRMNKEKPKIILIITDDFLRDLQDYRFLSPRIKGYIGKNYSLNKVFGPADVHGLGAFTSWVNLYKMEGA